MVTMRRQMVRKTCARLGKHRRSSIDHAPTANASTVDGAGQSP